MNEIAPWSLSLSLSLQSRTIHDEYDLPPSSTDRSWNVHQTVHQSSIICIVQMTFPSKASITNFPASSVRDLLGVPF